MSEIKKKKYLQSFKTVYSNEFPFIKKSSRSENHAFCTVCSSDFSIAHSGRGDILHHMSANKHKSRMDETSAIEKIDNFFSTAIDERMAVTRAECLFTAFVVEHNLPLSCTDHVGPLLRKMFPMDQTAKNYGCARTKTNAIIAEFSSEAQKKLVESLKCQPFCIGTDGSNSSDSKLFPLVVTHFSTSTQKIETDLLAVSTLKGDASGHNIGNLIVETLEKFNIPIASCIGFVADNAPVMIGKKSGVAAVLKEKQKEIIIIGCPCHLLNLASEKGSSDIPLNVDDLLVDIFFYLEKSAKRKEKLTMFQELHNGETQKILKHVCTRWLSLGKCLKRLISQWEPLISFFKDQTKVANKKDKSNLESYVIQKKKKSANEKLSIPVNSVRKVILPKKRIAYETSLPQPGRKKNPKTCDFKNKASHVLSREERIFYLLTSDINKAYCSFLSYIILSFDAANITLQSQAPLIHKLRSILLNFFEKMLSKFVQIGIIKACPDVLTVDYHTLSNQKDDKDLMIGCNTEEIVKDLQWESKEEFFNSVRAFYVKTCDYMKHKFPFSDAVLFHAEVCNCNTIEKSSFSSVKFFLDKFPVFLQGCDHDEKVDELQSEFCKLQLTELTEHIKNENRVDVQWCLIGEMQDNMNKKTFKNLSNVMLGILTIPHSNCECERIFSRVKKNRTEFRSSLSDDGLENLLIMKSSFLGKCFEQFFDEKFLSKAKSATKLKNLNLK